jgi:radical SAM protein (TIGR01212 family)
MNSISELYTRRPFNSYASWCKERFGSRLQKLSINAGFTCPNRDGNLGTEGCTFCNNEAFNPSYCHPEKSIQQQIDEGIEFHLKRYKRANKYIAYFQAYSNTYKKPSEAIDLYEQALNHSQISGISIGTRPDCLDDTILNYLKEKSETHHISVELGIESCYDKTLLRVKRGHNFQTTVNGFNKLAELRLFSTGHIILGLPGESYKEMLDEAKIISTLPLNAIKIHQLQILKGTIMEFDFLKNQDDFNLFCVEDYIEFVIDFLENLRPDIIIERLSGEVPPKFLSHSPWSMLRADQVLQKIEKRMIERNTWQGKGYLNSSL